MRRFVLALCVLGACTPAVAQDYPTRPIRALTATSAGGTSDVFMRVLGEEVRKRWGQPIVVENRPGGAMNVGGRACADAPNDGYTICILPPETLAYNQFLFKQIPYDPEKDFAPVTNPFFATQVMVVNASLNVHTLAELAALSKAKPGTLSYTAASIPLIAFMDKWTKETGADIVKVPFRGGAEAVNNVMGGSTPIAFFGLANWLSFIRNGTVNALAVDSHQALAAVARRADAHRARLRPKSHPALFRHRRADRRAGCDRAQAARRFRRDRQRSGVPAKAHDRHGARAGVRHAGTVRRFPENRPRRVGPHRSPIRHGAAVRCGR